MNRISPTLRTLALVFAATLSVLTVDLTGVLARHQAQAVHAQLVATTAAASGPHAGRVPA